MVGVLSFDEGLTNDSFVNAANSMMPFALETLSTHCTNNHATEELFERQLLDIGGFMASFGAIAHNRSH
jgi:hypothetical protein